VENIKAGFDSGRGVWYVLERNRANHYVNYHFSETITEEGIAFNYKLLEGPSTTRNAIKLLRHVGYPDEITDAADARVGKSKSG
jgi:DNA mismatch repair ATPase MutS